MRKISETSGGEVIRKREVGYTRVTVHYEKNKISLKVWLYLRKNENE